MESKKCKFIKYLISFLIPVVVLFVAMAIKGMWPFGDKSMLLWDMEIQYINIYNWYYDVLHGNANIFYDFSKSLGGNMYGVFSTYLASPICFFVYFFKPENMPYYITFATVMKIGLSGLTLFIYLNKRFNIESDLLKYAFAVSYALMEYNVGLCSNLHFMDAIYGLPIVALGTYYLIRDNKKLLFIISVAYIIISSWYIGYMTCLYIGFYFLFELILSEKDKLRSCIRFMYSAIVGAMISAITLIPSLLSTQSGKAEVNVDYLRRTFHCSFIEPLKGLMMTSQANVSYEIPAIYVGGLVVMMLLLGVFNKSISLKIKLAGLGLISIVLLSFSFVPLEVVWSALKKAYSFFFRHSFVFSFSMIVVAAMFYEKTEKLLNIKSVICSIAVLVVYGIIGVLCNYFEIIDYIINAAIVLIYIFIAFPDDKDKKLKLVKNCLLVIALSAELVFNACLEFNRYSVNCSEYSRYTKETESLLSGVTQNDDSFYRLEKTFSEMDVRRGKSRPVATEGLTYNYNAITHYSSLVDTRVNNFLYLVGYKNNDIRQANYVDSNPVMDSLLGVSYLFSTREEPMLSKIGEGEIHNAPVGVYKNDYAADLIIPIESSDKIEWDKNPFRNQQKLLNYVAGSDSKVIKRLKYKKMEDGSWEISVSRDGPVYIYFLRNHDAVDLKVNGKFIQNYFGRFNNNVCYIGTYSKGDKVSVTLDNDKDIMEQHNLYACVINVKKYSKVFSQIKNISFDPDYISDRRISFDRVSENDEKLLVTIPFDEGWTIYVDGKKYRPSMVYDTFYLIELTKGNHSVVMKYMPPWLIKGGMISLLGIIIVIIIGVFEKKERKKND